MFDNSMLVGLSRQVALRRQMDVIANNLANLGTNGFRGEDVVFAEHLMPVAEISAARPGDRTLSYVVDKATAHDFSPGTISHTGNAFDFALEGNGWFVVQTPQGERYTRNGALRLDGDRALVTAGGYPVLGEGGPIVFDEQETGITVAADGTISTSEGDKDRLRLATFADNALLEAEGASLFSSPAAPIEAELGEVSVLQGALEGSNVQPILEMSKMIEVTRSYTSLSRMMERTDELRRDAINTLGRVE